jgi:hypothetical protein
MRGFGRGKFVHVYGSPRKTCVQENASWLWQTKGCLDVSKYADNKTEFRVHQSQRTKKCQLQVNPESVLIAEMLKLHLALGATKCKPMGQWQCISLLSMIQAYQFQVFT